MKLSLLLVFLLNFLFLTFATSPNYFHVHRLSQTSLRTVSTIPIICGPEFELHLYNQTIDHFNYRPGSYETFRQRYFINRMYWKLAENPNPNPPIFVYFGAEVSLNSDKPCFEGFMTENAPTYGALMVFIEHRYYGSSTPNDTTEDILGYFNSAQALADYAEIILHVKQDFQAQDSPVLVVGASYGGMLSSWFRLKYPHIAFGALASSAPILYFDDITPQSAFYDKISMVFKEESEHCFSTIKESWQAIDTVANYSNGINSLSNIFDTCRPLSSGLELKYYLIDLYEGAVQFNLPQNRVHIICQAVDKFVGNDDDNNINIVKAIAAGVRAYIPGCITPESLAVSTRDGWSWQVCSEMVFPIITATGDDPNSMFESYGPFNFTSFSNRCIIDYGVAPRPHWVTTYYGGHNIANVLRKFGSNIIFSNGLKDPYSVAGVLDNISDTIVAVTTENGSHCLDISPSIPGEDPDWLTEQRKTENKIIQEWLLDYYANLPKIIAMPTQKSYFI